MMAAPFEWHPTFLFSDIEPGSHCHDSRAKCPVIFRDMDVGINLALDDLTVKIEDLGV